MRRDAAHLLKKKFSWLLRCLWTQIYMALAKLWQAQDFDGMWALPVELCKRCGRAILRIPSTKICALNVRVSHVMVFRTEALYCLLLNRSPVMARIQYIWNIDSTQKLTHLNLMVYSCSGTPEISMIHIPSNVSDVPTVPRVEISYSSLLQTPKRL